MNSPGESVSVNSFSKRGGDGTLFMNVPGWQGRDHWSTHGHTWPHLHRQRGQPLALTGASLVVGTTVALAGGSQEMVTRLDGHSLTTVQTEDGLEHQGTGAGWQTTSQDPLHQCEVELIMSYGVTHLISNVSGLLLLGDGRLNFAPA
jgi:hypothetical protein